MVNFFNTPKEIAENYVDIGITKVDTQIIRYFLLSVMGGIFIALAAGGANTVFAIIENPGVSRLIGAMIFPVGLIMVLIAGANLLTGDCLIIISVLDKKVSIRKMLRTWLVAYLGNFVGSVFIAYLINRSNQIGFFSGEVAVTTIGIASLKVLLPFTNALILGILCNILVCTAIWIGLSAKTIAGKVLGAYMPVMLFVLSGYEHSVANMYYIPAGIMALGNEMFTDMAVERGIDVLNLNWGTFIVNNLIPVTIGNIIGGSILIGMMYWYVHLKKDSTI